MPLSRPRHEMPADVEAALSGRGLTDAYGERPDYQQNDYVGWITRARSDATRQKRLDQMLDKLERGGVYMNMRHEPSAR